MEECTYQAGQNICNWSRFAPTIIKHIALICEQDDRLHHRFCGRGRTAIQVFIETEMTQSECDAVSAKFKAVEARYSSPERREMRDEVRGMFVYPSHHSKRPSLVDEFQEIARRAGRGGR